VTEPKMKPCPFCGAIEPEIQLRAYGASYYFVQCNNCSADGPDEMNQESSIASWNRRVE
jgi:Lar family restriction alleviation protein